MLVAGAAVKDAQLNAEEAEGQVLSRFWSQGRQ